MYDTQLGRACKKHTYFNGKQAIFPESDMVVYVPQPNHTVTVTQCEPCNVTYATSLFIPLKATDISPLHSPVFILRSTFRSSRQPQLY